MKAVCKTLALAAMVMMLASLPALAKEAKHCLKKKTTEWQSPENVHWANRLVSYGNYLKVDKAKIPAPKVAAAAPKPRTAPKFDPVYFDLDKSTLRPEAAETLKKVVEYLNKNGADKVNIEGNCCDLASNEYNQKLGQRRADAVKSYLVENGIKADRICTKSNGEGKQVYQADQRAKNRRADVIVSIVVK